METRGSKGRDAATENAAGETVIQAGDALTPPAAPPAFDIGAILAAIAAQGRKAEEQATELRTEAREAQERASTEADRRATEVREALARAGNETKDAISQLDARLTGVISTESARLQASLQREITAVNDRADLLSRNQDQLRGDVNEQKTRLTALTTTVHNQEQEVNRQLACVSERLNAVQRELYARVPSGVVNGSIGSVTSPDQLLETRGVAKTRARPAFYDGKIPFSVYLTQFDVIAQLNSWDVEERTAMLISVLTGPALNTLNNLASCDRRNYDTLTRALTQRFDQGQSAELARVQLDTRRKRSNETLREYAESLEITLHAAYPGINTEMRNMLLTDKFVNGLCDMPELRRELRLRRMPTFEETLQNAIQLNTIITAETDSDRSSSRRFVRGVEAGEDVSEVMFVARRESDERGDERQQDSRGNGRWRKRRRSGNEHDGGSSGGRGVGEANDVTPGGSAANSEELSSLRQAVKALAARFDNMNGRPQGAVQGRARSTSPRRAPRLCWICRSDQHLSRTCPENTGRRAGPVSSENETR